MLIGLFLFLLELYIAAFAIFMIVLLVKRKKLPINVLLINILCLGLLWWLKYEVEEHNIVFNGSYDTPADDWGEGLANFLIHIMNLAIVYVVAFVTQVIFIKVFSREFRKLNPGQ